jgi:hypothetical protein
VEKLAKGHHAMTKEYVIQSDWARHPALARANEAHNGFGLGTY